jgi:bacillithiol system protein YtxJ
MDLHGSKGEQQPIAARDTSEGGFIPLPDAGALAGLLTRSHDAPVLLFLHDPHCPISRRAWGEMERLAEGPLSDAYLVNVSRQRAVSKAIEAQTGVRHESPQALVLRGGEAVWDASHFAITAEDVSAVLANSAQD